MKMNPRVQEARDLYKRSLLEARDALSEALATVDSEGCSGHGPEALRMAIGLEKATSHELLASAHRDLDKWIERIREAQEADVPLKDVPFSLFQQCILRGLLPEHLKDSCLSSYGVLDASVLDAVSGWPRTPTRVPDGVSLQIASRYFGPRGKMLCPTHLTVDGLLLPSSISLVLHGNIRTRTLDIVVDLCAAPSPSSPVSLERLQWMSAATIKRYQKALAVFDCEDAREAIRIMGNAIKSRSEK